MAFNKPMRMVAAIAVAAFLAACGEEKAETDQAAATGGSEQQAPAPGYEVVEANCASCHAPDDSGRLSRISEQRKTPEGWDMTVARMIVAHGLEISPDDRRAVVKYLADNQGLAPEEAAPFRYALERRPQLVETEVLDGVVDERLFVMCGRCHTVARVALQRRDAEEWRHLVDMHVSQWPTIEYHMLSRDRDWLDEAKGWVSDLLGKEFALSSRAYDDWKAAEKPNPAGAWRVVSYVPGEGYTARDVTVTAAGDGFFDVSDRGARAVVYNGYEWRARGDENYREVAALSRDGTTLVGRWFRNDRPELGGTLLAVRSDTGASRILAVTSEGLRQGSSVELTILGTGLEGDADFGPGIEVETLRSAPGEIVVRVTVADDAAIGRRDVRVGEALLADAVAVYDRIDRVVVTPDYAVARVGGGNTAPVAAQFEAVAFHNGADGKADTDDDFRIGVVPAEWQTGPFDETAAEMKDAEFAGEITPTGLFNPAPAGPNPKRRYNAGNFGDLTITATVDDAGRKVSGVARLIVSAQRWNNPPIY